MLKKKGTLNEQFIMKKKEKKKKMKMKTKTKTYRTIEKDGKKKRKRRNLNIVEHSIWKKERKKEQTFLVK